MVINRRYSRQRQGPSCLLIITVGVVFALGMYVVSNAEEVRQAIIPTPTAEPTRSAPEYATSAALYVRDGELAQAAEAYQKAIELDADNVNYYMALIPLLTTIGRSEEALEWAEKVQVLAPESDAVWTIVAAAYLANADRLIDIGDRAGADLQYQEGLTAARKATSLNPNNADAYAYAALAILEFGPDRYREGQELAALAVDLAPESPTAHRAMAAVYNVFALYDNAIEEYLLAIDYAPHDLSLQIDLAYLYFFTDRRQEAVLTLQDIVQIDPANADAYDGLAYFYFVLGQYPQSEENAFVATQLDPTMIRAHAHLGAAYFKQFKYDTAIEELEIAVDFYETVTPSNATYFNMLGLAYYFTNPSGRCQEANELFQQVLVAAPDPISEASAQEGIELCRQAQLQSP